MHTHIQAVFSRKNACTLTGIFLFLLLLLPLPARAQFSKSDESISTSIYTIIVNTTWENNGFSRFVIGVADPEPELYNLLQQKYSGLKIRGKSVQVQHFPDLESIGPVQVLCVGKKFNRRIEAIWNMLPPKGTLLITNSSGKAKFNMVDFNGRLSRTDFKVNRANISAAGMTMSEKFSDFAEGNGNWEAMVRESSVKLETSPKNIVRSPRPAATPTDLTDYDNMSIEQKIILLDNQTDLLRKQAAEIAKKAAEISEKEKEIRRQLATIRSQKLVLNEQLQQLGMQKVVLWLFVLVIALVIIVALVLYYSYRNKRTSLRELAEKNNLVMHQKDQIEKILHELTDSIHYAHRIQNAVLPDDQAIRKSIPGDYFVMYQPKDIVSGDFFFVDHRKDWTFVAVADCTGHGVPGAFVSMLCISLLNEILRQQETPKANVILNELREKVITALQQRGIPGEQMDGMDISLLLINVKTLKCQWSGANNPLYVVSGREFTEMKPDKRPISIYPDMNDFTNHELELKKGDKVYLFTDGYADQFGGSKGKKFMSRNFKNMIAENAHLSMREQSDVFTETLHNWKHSNGLEYDQIDDITLFGIKID